MPLEPQVIAYMLDALTDRIPQLYQWQQTLVLKASDEWSSTGGLSQTQIYLLEKLYTKLGIKPELE